MTRSKEVLPPSGALAYAEDAFAACADADAVLILTDWQEFATLDLDRSIKPSATQSWSTAATSSTPR